MSNATRYLIAIVCFALATAAGTIAFILGQGHWVQIVIPLAVLICMIPPWLRARQRTT